jgi:N,N-dimethylformamidase beta subunit-like, C-terminal
MATVTAHLRGRGVRNVSLLLAAVGSAAILLGLGTSHESSDEDLEGRAPTAEELQPSVAVAFRHESYPPGATALLVFFDHSRGVKLRIFRTGPEHTRTVGYSEMRGVPVTVTERIGLVRKGRAVRISVGNWPSGLYFARLEAADGRVGFAPFVVRPRRLGEHRVAIVLPTMTWQAYNLRDDDGDGKGDSWYARWNVHTARLGRPFLNRGVPYNFRRYDLPFLHWLAWTGRQVDVLSDADLDSVRDAKQLRESYDLIVFPGHHEYVTTYEYDVVEGYRNRGGNLAFLSANNFFWRVVKHGDLIEKTEQWRDLGRPEAALIGVQYRGNDRGEHRGAWVARERSAARWLFAGTGLKDGSTFGEGGIEIDETTADSPPGIQVLAQIPDIFGPGFTAQMTYYETAAGAKVFAAGAFRFVGSILDDPIVTTMMGNLWARLACP